MLNFLKKIAVSIVLLSPESLAILLVGILMELVYRTSLYLGLLNSGMEFLAAGFGFTAFFLLLLIRFLVYRLKK